MPAKSVSQKIAAREELDRRLNGEDPFKFKGLTDEDLKEIASTPSNDLPDKANL